MTLSSRLLLSTSDTLAVRQNYQYRMPHTQLLLPEPARITIRNRILNGAPNNWPPSRLAA